MNLIFTAFATLEGYREGSNANLGSEVFYRCIVVSLVSAKQKNQNCDAALVTNTAVPEPYAAQLSQAGIRVIACPFDNYRFEADLDWSLAYYKLCAMQYLLETEHYENYLMLDSDTFTQRGYQDIWREAAEAVLLYQDHKPQLLELAEPLVLPPPSAREQQFQALWTQFYRTLEIQARHNEKGRMTHCPKRFWADMVEMRGEL